MIFDQDKTQKIAKSVKNTSFQGFLVENCEIE